MRQANAIRPRFRSGEKIDHCARIRGFGLPPDRVGGGDGYAAGFFYGLLGGESPQDAVNLGWAHGALLTTFPGDTTMASLAQVEALAKGGSARIQR